MNKWQMIIELNEIAETPGSGTEWRETVTENGETYTREIKKAAAIAAAARLLRAVNAGKPNSRADLNKAQTVIKLAQWHRVDPGGGI